MFIFFKGGQSRVKLANRLNFQNCRRTLQFLVFGGYQQQGEEISISLLLPHLQLQLGFVATTTRTTLHHISISIFKSNHTTLHYITLHYITPHHTTPHCSAVHNITPQYITLTLHHTYVQYITPTLHHTTPHHGTLHYPSLRDTIGHYTTLPATKMTTTTATTPRCATLQDATLHEPHFTTIHPIAVYQIRPHYTTLHHTIPHHTDHIELHCTTLATVTTTSSAIVPFWSEFVSICGMQVRISFYTHRIWKKISCRLEKQCS